MPPVRIFHRIRGFPICLLILLAALTGCISIKYSESGITEESTIDYAKMGADIFREADLRSQSFEAGAETLPPDHPLVVRADAILTRILENTDEKQKSVGGGFFDEHESFEYYNEEMVRLRILVQDSPLAVVYPNGALFLTSGLLDKDLPYAAANPAQMAGIIAHEFVHLFDGHVLRQWIVIKSRQKEVYKKFLSGFTKALPIVEFDYQPGASYEYAPVFDHLIEYVADRRAMEIMKALGYDPHEYLRFLHRLRAYRDRYPSSAEEPYGWIDGRIAALEQLRAPTEAAFYVQYKESGQKKRCDLDADDQYNLVMVADIYLKPQERGLISEWLAAPDNRYLNDLLNDFSEASQKRIGEYILGVLTRRYGPFWQLQLHSAPDAD